MKVRRIVSWVAVISVVAALALVTVARYCTRGMGSGRSSDSVQHHQFRLLLKFLNPDGTHDEWLRQRLIEAGVPADQTDYESCRAAAKQHLREQLESHRRKRMNTSERGVVSTLWSNYADEEKRIYEDARTLGLSVTEIRSPLSQESLNKQDGLLKRLCASGVGESRRGETLIPLILITPHETGTVDQVIHWIEEVKDTRRRSRFWDYILDDSDPEVVRFLHQRLLAAIGNPEAYIRLFKLGCFQSNKETERLIRAAPSENSLQGALQHIRWIGGPPSFLEELVFDSQLPLTHRCVLARKLVGEIRDRKFSRRILERPSDAESDGLKIAILEEGLEPGVQNIDIAAVRKTAVSKEGPAVHSAAVRYLSDRVKSSERWFMGGGERYEGDALNRRVLRQIADSAGEDPGLRRLASEALSSDASVVERLEKKLKDMQTDPRRVAALTGIEDKDEMGLNGPYKQYVEFEMRITLHNWENQIVQCTLELLYARIMSFADEHDGRLPEDLRQLASDHQVRGQSYLYFPLREMKDLTSSMILLSTPRALTFGDGTEVVVMDGRARPKLKRMKKSAYQRLADSNERKAPILHPFFEGRAPELFLIMGDGSLEFLNESNVESLIEDNNRTRRKIGADAIPVSPFRRLLNAGS